MPTESVHSSKLTKALNSQEGLFAWKIIDNYAGGVPDIFLEGSAQDLWVEAKRIHPTPKRDSTWIDLCNEKYLSKLQQGWLKRRDKQRGDARVLLYTDDLGWAVLTVTEACAPWLWGVLKTRFKKPALVMAELHSILEGNDHGKTIH